jgi:redox-sensitive bicupin YhaK (pirin superfamily)
MITLRRSSERHHTRHAGREVWLDFFGGNPADAPLQHAGALEIFAEVHLVAGARGPRIPMGEAEIITYVRQGAVAFSDSLGAAGALSAGEFGCFSPGPATQHTERNTSKADPAELFQVWLQPVPGAPRAHREQQRFTTPARSGRLLLVASGDGRLGSLHLAQNASLFSGLFDSGQHAVYPLERSRSVWLQVLSGSVSLDELTLHPGDGVRVEGERAVSFTAGADCEVLLLDLPARVSRGS